MCLHRLLEWNKLTKRLHNTSDTHMLLWYVSLVCYRQVKRSCSLKPACIMSCLLTASFSQGCNSTGLPTSTRVTTMNVKHHNKANDSNQQNNSLLSVSETRLSFEILPSYINFNRPQQDKIKTNVLSMCVTCFFSHLFFSFQEALGSSGNVKSLMK